MSLVQAKLSSGLERSDSKGRQKAVRQLDGLFFKGE
jgi:hypothetical protein